MCSFSINLYNTIYHKFIRISPAEVSTHLYTISLKYAVPRLTFPSKKKNLVLLENGQCTYSRNLQYLISCSCAIFSRRCLSALFSILRIRFCWLRNSSSAETSDPSAYVDIERNRIRTFEFLTYLRTLSYYVTLQTCRILPCAETYL